MTGAHNGPRQSETEGSRLLGAHEELTEGSHSRDALARSDDACGRSRVPGVMDEEAGRLSAAIGPVILKSPPGLVARKLRLPGWRQAVASASDQIVPLLE